jgi:hypothetical protein
VVVAGAGAGAAAGAGAGAGADGAALPPLAALDEPLDDVPPPREPPPLATTGTGM